MNFSAIGFDLVAIGSWTIFDHIFRLGKYPASGETVTLDMPTENLNRIYFGECSANVAAAGARLGLRTALVMVVGDDFVISGYEAHLRSLGVDLSGVSVVEGARSGHSYLFFEAGGDGFCISHLGLAADQNEWDVPEQLLDAARAVVINEMYSPFTLKAATRARVRGAMVAINGMVGKAGKLVEEFLTQTDVLVINQPELEELLQLLEVNGVGQLLIRGPSAVFVTQGSRGSTVYLPDRDLHVEPVRARRLVDPTGAGDAYAAGVICGLLRGYPPLVAARIGGTVASFVVEAWGCQTNLPEWELMEERYQESFGELPNA